MPSWRPYRVEVEFMDGERRTYDCGGMMAPHEAVKEGTSVLVLHKRNGEFANTVHVATLPFANIREYKVREASEEANRG